MGQWDPFADVFHITERFGGRFKDGWPAEALLAGDGGAATPCADVFDDREGVTVEVELPGVAAQDLAVTVAGDTVVVEAERRLSNANGRRVRSLEGRYGRMRREFVLPVRTETEHALAELCRGVLRIFVPRAQARSTATFTLPVRDEEPVEVPVG